MTLRFVCMLSTMISLNQIIRGISMDQIRIGKFIQVLRKGKNLTQAELANKLGVSDRAVSK